MKGDLSGHFEHLMVALVTPPAVFDAKQLKKSMKGAGTNEDALTEILTTRTSRQMKEISQAYYTSILFSAYLHHCSHIFKPMLLFPESSQSLHEAF